MVPVPTQNTFQKLAQTAQRIAETRGSNSKIKLCSEYFKSIETDEDLNLAAQFLAEGAFPTLSSKRASVGSRTYSTCAADFCKIDYEKVFKPCKTALGSASEAIEKLMNNIDSAREKRSAFQLSLEQINQIFEHLYQASSLSEKQKILSKAWTKMSPVEIKYFIRILSQGSLRIGFESRSVVAALAEAFNKKIDDTSFAHMIIGSIGRTAILCKNNNLNKIAFKLFHPLSFMLASPIESRDLGNLEGYVAEEKFDGMRAQCHISGQKIKLFSRDLNNITQTFPDILQFFINKKLPSLVLDGEICVYKNDEILPFQLLQKRMGRKKPDKKILEQSPTLFIAFDILYFNDSPVFEQPLTDRRKLLEKLSKGYSFPISNQFGVDNREHVDDLFDRALAHGNEGLMLKKKKSSYEYGKRGKSWLKVKKPSGTLDTVILYAHAGSGKRGGFYSDFTLGISVKDDERYEEEFIPIGKAYSGYTDEEMQKLNQRIKDLTAEKYGSTLGLIPKIVVEIEFDDIQVNRRTKANYTLRLPRFKAIRWDLSPKDVDTLKDVERLYQDKINRDRIKQDKNPSFYF